MMSIIDPDSIGKLRVIRVKVRSKKEKLRIRLSIGIGIFIVLGLLLSTQYRVTRFSSFQAKPLSIHAYLNDLNQWKDWAPWIINDPGTIVTLGDIETGVGASQSWVGKDGEGSMTITQSSLENGIDFNLSLNDGLYQSKASIHCKKVNGKTYVTWAVEGNVAMPVVGGYWALLMEPIAGSMLEQGLVRLKEVVVKRGLGNPGLKVGAQIANKIS